MKFPYFTALPVRFSRKKEFALMGLSSRKIRPTDSGRKTKYSIPAINYSSCRITCLGCRQECLKSILFSKRGTFLLFLASWSDQPSYARAWKIIEICFYIFLIILPKITEKEIIFLIFRKTSVIKTCSFVQLPTTTNTIKNIKKVSHGSTVSCSIKEP